MWSARRMAGLQVDDVCCALLALSLGTTYLCRVLLACPALLACKPAALTAQAGTQPVPNLAACMPCTPVPVCPPVVHPRRGCCELSSSA